MKSKEVVGLCLFGITIASLLLGLLHAAAVLCVLSVLYLTVKKD